MAIDYDQDIAPLRQQYFPMLAGDKGFDQAMKYRQEVTMPMQLHTMKIERHSMSMMQADLAYENQKLELTRSRLKTQSQLQFMEKLPELMQDLENITGDPDKDPYEATKSLIGLQMKYLPSAQHNPLLGNLFNFAGQSIAANRSQTEKEEREARADESRKLGQMTQLAQMGGYDQARDLAGAEVDENEAPIMDLAKIYQDRGVATSELQAQKAEAHTIGQMGARAKEIETALRGMNTETVNANWDFAVTGSPKEASTKIADEFVLKKINKAALVSYYIDMMKSYGYSPKKADVEAMDDRELYQNTLEKVLEQRRILEQYSRGGAGKSPNASALMGS